jgi:hypothetical protein
MRQTKPVGSLSSGNGGSPTVTPRTFVRAAGFTNLLVGASIVIEFCVLAAIFRDTNTLLVGLSLLFLISIATWTTAAVLGGVTLLPRWLWVFGRRLIRPTRPSPRGWSGVWDEWLDGPIRL